MRRCILCGEKVYSYNSRYEFYDAQEKERYYYCSTCTQFLFKVIKTAIVEESMFQSTRLKSESEAKSISLGYIVKDATSRPASDMSDPVLGEVKKALIDKAISFLKGDTAK